MKVRGRPKGKSLLTKEEICVAALTLLDETGAKGLSMRSLANSLKITPMAIYNHFADRAALIRTIADQVYIEVSQDFEQSSGSPRKRTELLLVSYYKMVLQHPNLTLAIFESPSAFSTEALRITNFLESLLKESRLSSSKRRIWLEILVDFTNGSSIAIAASQVSDKSDKSPSPNHFLKYQRALSELLDRIF